LRCAIFLRRERRTPLPETLTWECSDGAAQTRAGWVRIDRVRASKERQLADVNLMPMPPTREFGVMAIGTRVNTVVTASSAARVGLRRGDIVMRVDGTPLPAGEDFDQALTRCCRPANPIASRADDDRGLRPRRARRKRINTRNGETEANEGRGTCKPVGPAACGRPCVYLCSSAPPL